MEAAPFKNWSVIAVEIVCQKCEFYALYHQKWIAENNFCTFLK